MNSFRNERWKVAKVAKVTGNTRPDITHMQRAEIPRNGMAKEPLSADAYAFFLNDAINFGPETQAFQNLNTWPEAFEPLAGRLVVIRDEASRKRTRASPGRVTWKSPRGWKPLKSVTNLPVMVRTPPPLPPPYTPHTLLHALHSLHIHRSICSSKWFTSSSRHSIVSHHQKCDFTNVHFFAPFSPVHFSS